MRILLLALLMTLPVPAGAEFEISFSHQSPMSGDVTAGSEAALKVGSDYYLWASYSSHDHWIQTQIMGDIALAGIGAGIRQSGWFLDVGVGYLMSDYSERVMREAVHYLFVPIYGQPHFMEPGRDWNSLTQRYDPSRYGPMFRVGHDFRLGDRVGVAVAYQVFVTSAYFATWSDEWDGVYDPAALDRCSCYWEGTQHIDLSGPRISITYRF